MSKSGRNETTLLPPERPLRWRPEYMNLLRPAG